MDIYTDELLISELRVLHSAAGYYLGTEYWDDEINCWLPNSRESGYMDNTHANALLPKEIAYTCEDDEIKAFHAYWAQRNIGRHTATIAALEESS